MLHLNFISLGLLCSLVIISTDKQAERRTDSKTNRQTDRICEYCSETELSQGVKVEQPFSHQSLITTILLLQKYYTFKGSLLRGNNVVQAMNSRAGFLRKVSLFSWNLRIIRSYLRNVWSEDNYVCRCFFRILWLGLQWLPGTWLLFDCCSSAWWTFCKTTGLWLQIIRSMSSTTGLVSFLLYILWL